MSINNNIISNEDLAIHLRCPVTFEMFCHGPIVSLSCAHKISKTAWDRLPKNFAEEVSCPVCRAWVKGGVDPWASEMIRILLNTDASERARTVLLQEFASASSEEKKSFASPPYPGKLGVFETRGTTPWKKNRTDLPRLIQFYTRDHDAFISDVVLAGHASGQISLTIQSNDPEKFSQFLSEIGCNMKDADRIKKEGFFNTDHVDEIRHLVSLLMTHNTFSGPGGTMMEKIVAAGKVIDAAL